MFAGFRIGIITSLMIATVAHATENIPVFYSTVLPSDVRQKALNDALSKDNLSFSVFAKYQDFITEVNAKNSNIVIAPAVFGLFSNSYQSAMQFTVNSQTARKYLVLALAPGWKPQQASSTKAGLVEEIDRGNLKEYLKHSTKLDFKQIKSVTKAEDLFPMLMFKFTDVIVVSSEEAAKLKEKFTTPTFTVQETDPVEYPQVFVKKGYDATEVLKTLQGLSGDTAQALGFTKLEALKGGQP